MGIFDRFKKNNTPVDTAQDAWNRMWELWTEGQVPSPYAELMTYQSEVNNGGHDQYFFNMENTGDLQKELVALEAALPQRLWENLREAFEAYLLLAEKEDNESAEQTLARCDRVFYENEAELDRVLRQYAVEFE